MVMVQAPMTGGWSHREKNKFYGQAFVVVHPFFKRAPFRNRVPRRSRAAFRCLSIRIGRSIQGKVPEIIVGRVGTQKDRFRTQTKAAKSKLIN